MSFVLGPFEALEAGLWSSKPDVPNFHWTDLVQQQLDTAAGNLGVLPSSEELGSQVNDFMRGERGKTLATIPGLTDIEGQTTKDLSSWLRGELPADVSSAVSRASNARAYAGGYGGSGMGRNLQARDLGLTSLNLMQSAVPLGQQYAQNEYRMRAVPEYDPTSMFLNPMQSAQFNAAQQQQNWQRDWLANQIAAQPEPWQQSIMNSTQQAGAMGDMMLGSFAGGGLGALGGMGGGMTGGAPPAVGSNSSWAAAPYPSMSMGGGYDPWTLGGYNYSAR